MKQFISIDPNKIDDLPLLEIEDSFLSLTEIHTSITENIKNFLNVALSKEHASFVRFNYNNRNLCLLNDKRGFDIDYARNRILLFDIDNYEKIGFFKISDLMFEKQKFLEHIDFYVNIIIKHLNVKSDPNTSIPKDILTTENIVEIKWEEFKHV